MRRVAPSGWRVATRIAPVVAAAALALACTEDPLALLGDAAPGATSETRDVSVDVADLESWRDTTYTGFALPTNASFTVVANGPILRARTFGRLVVPDTVRTFTDTLPAESYEGLVVHVALDTLRSEYASFPVTLKLVSLTRGFSVDEVSWTEARSGVPWMTPGGDLGPVIGAAEITEVTDSVDIEPGVSTDSLLKAWRAEDGGNGFVILAEGPEAEVQIRSIRFEYDATLEGRENPVVQTQLLTTKTFATDPPQPPPGTALRVGGLPSARFYLDFATPDSVQGVPLARAQINYAELVFQPLAAPAAPFALEGALTGRQVTLLGDPFVLGPKTPVGAAPASFASLQPDSLAAGMPIRLNITTILSGAVRDSATRIRIGLRPEPDAQTLGFWEFGSVESAPALRPRLRIILTPPADFELPS